MMFGSWENEKHFQPLVAFKHIPLPHNDPSSSHSYSTPLLMNKAIPLPSLLYRPLKLSHPHSLLARAMSQARRAPKRFAPLDPKRSNESGAPPLKGIVFDVDGTLW